MEFDPFPNELFEKVSFGLLCFCMGVLFDCKKAPPHGGAQTVKKPRVALEGSQALQLYIKIGDLCGDVRTILLAKSLPYTSERP